MSLEKEFDGNRYLILEENSELAKNASVGGGTEIPTPTLNDIGAYLMVKQTGISNPQTIASEQTITFGDDFTAQIVTSSLALFVENAGVKATINDIVYYGRIIDDSGLTVPLIDTNGDRIAEIFVGNDTLMIYDRSKSAEDTETIKIEIGDVVVGTYWEKNNK